MQKRPVTNILKSRPKRTVYRELESGPGREPHVVKRFHAPGFAQGLWDGVRARREARGLQRWRALGLPAPAPVAVRRQAGHWELVLEAVPQARPLPQYLLQDKSNRGQILATAAAVGQLLARLDRSGAHHGDPHPGNLLIDHTGRPWLIDPTPLPMFSSRSKPGWHRWVRFCGQLREGSSAIFRARVAAAYRASDGPAPAPDTEAERQRMELEARDWRYAEGVDRAARWLRTSGATQVEGSVIHRLHPPTGQDRMQEFSDLNGARQVWLNYARLHEHRIPCVQARALHLTETPAIESIQMEGMRAFDASSDRGGLARLLGLLHDRGLALEPLEPGDLWTAPDGSVCLDPASVRTLEGPATPWMEPRLPHWLGELDPGFVDCFLGTLGGTRAQVAGLEATLHG